MSSNRRNKTKAKNMYFDSNPGASTNFSLDKKGADRNLRNIISPVQLQRMRTDIQMWRDAITEAERAYYPFRVKMQRMYIDTILNGHVFSVMERRKDLTTLRKFKLSESQTDKSNEEWTNYFQNAQWFKDFVEYSLDALFFGYSLISLGDIVDQNVKDVSIIPRWFVSPDRHVVGTFIYSPSGKDFREEPYADWHCYVKTKSDNGVSPCGYGLFYQIAKYEIYLRNTLGYNADFVELYAMPYRVGKTTKTNETERAELEAAVRDMGSAGYAIIDPNDEIEFLESVKSGTGYTAYDNLELRCQKAVSKIVLGHADAMDSIPGKLGSQSGENNPIHEALEDKKTKDGQFIENVVNELLFPKLRNLGIVIPEGLKFMFLNDKELMKARIAEDTANKTTAEVAQTMKNAGLKMDPKYFSERTGIPTEEIEEPKEVPSEDDLRNQKQVKNKLAELYKI